MRLQVAVLALLGSLAIASAVDFAAAEPDTTSCLNGLGPALQAGGFSGSLDCQSNQLSVRYIGEVQAAARTFQVYSYRYRLKPVCRECAVHGGQRILFMERGRYVGQYKPDSAQVATRGGELVLTPTSG